MVIDVGCRIHTFKLSNNQPSVSANGLRPSVIRHPSITVCGLITFEHVGTINIWHDCDNGTC